MLVTHPHRMQVSTPPSVNTARYVSLAVSQYFFRLIWHPTQEISGVRILACFQQKTTTKAREKKCGPFY